MRLAVRPAILIVGRLDIALRWWLRVVLVVAITLLSLLRAIMAVALLLLAVAIVIVSGHIEARTCKKLKVQEGLGAMYGGEMSSGEC
jgi:hypothetical protein